jgi:hypothetical protein
MGIEDLESQRCARISPLEINGVLTTFTRQFLELRRS